MYPHGGGRHDRRWFRLDDGASIPAGHVQGREKVDGDPPVSN